MRGAYLDAHFLCINRVTRVAETASHSNARGKCAPTARQCFVVISLSKTLNLCAPSHENGQILCAHTILNDKSMPP